MLCTMCPQFKKYSEISCSSWYPAGLSLCRLRLVRLGDRKQRTRERLIDESTQCSSERGNWVLVKAGM